MMVLPVFLSMLEKMSAAIFLNKASFSKHKDLACLTFNAGQAVWNIFEDKKALYSWCFCLLLTVKSNSCFLEI